MKVAIVGAGYVGKAIFHDLQHINFVNEITLVGRNIEKVKAEVLDARDAAVLRKENGPKLYYGGYEGTEGADVIVFAAGSSKIQTDRMEMLHANCVIVEEIFGEIEKYNKNAVIICVTNPLDVVTMKIQKYFGKDPHKVIGSGTLLESARLERFVSDFLEISDKSIQMSVVGEHGASAVALLSSVRIMGLSVSDYLKTITDEQAILSVKRLEAAFKKEPFRILYGKGYTSAGASATACRIVSAIASDSREILQVSSVLQGEYGLTDVALSVPSVIGKNGIEEIMEVFMDEDEKAAFLASAEKIREAAATQGIV